MERRKLRRKGSLKFIPSGDALQTVQIADFAEFLAKPLVEPNARGVQLRPFQQVVFRDLEVTF